MALVLNSKTLDQPITLQVLIMGGQINCPFMSGVCFPGFPAPSLYKFDLDLHKSLGSLEIYTICLFIYLFIYSSISKKQI